VSRSRSEQRAAFSAEVRIELLEQDADEQETGFDRLRGELQTIRQLATGILTALVVASIMLAINLAVAR
jgi:cell division protein FtsX